MMLNRTTVQFQGHSPRHKAPAQDDPVPHNYVRMLDNQDNIQLAQQPKPAKPGKAKQFWYKALDLFSPTSLTAVQTANNNLMQRHLTIIEAIQKPLNTYLAMRRQYNLQPSLIPKKAPAQLLDAQQRCKELNKELEKHIAMLTAATKRHGVSFDGQQEALGTAVQRSQQHLHNFQTELDNFFPKKKESALDHNLLLLMDPTSIELEQVNTHLDQTKIVLASPNLRL